MGMSVAAHGGRYFLNEGTFCLIKETYKTVRSVKARACQVRTFFV
jgi:hypothetical protein